MISFHLSGCGYRQKDNNTYYPNHVEIESFDDLKYVAEFDHVLGKYTNNYREDANFQCCDVLFCDLDNTHSDAPEDWKTADDVADLFPDTPFYYIYSRNHMKMKNGKEARPKFHLYFPLSTKIEDTETYGKLWERVANFTEKHGIVFDPQTKDAARMFYGVEHPGGGFFDGEKTIDQLPLPGVKNQGALTVILDDNYDQQKSMDYVLNFLLEHSIEPAADIYEIKNHPVHGGGLAIPVDCPWKEEHTEDTGKHQSVIIIDKNGQINYLCRHGHCDGRGWKDYKNFHILRDLPAEPELFTEDDAIELSKISNLSLHLTKDDNIKSDFFNFCQITQLDKYLEGKIRLNLLSQTPEISGCFWDITNHEIKDNDYDEITRYISRLYQIDNQKKVVRAVNRTASWNSYHPVRDRLLSLRFEGKSMIGDLFPKYLGAEKSKYTEAVTRLLLSGAIERAFNPGCKFDYCPILADTKQGTGKSTMVRYLALNDDWFSDSLQNINDNKKSFEEIRGRWIVEMAEMIATNKTKDVEVIKGYLSKQFDDYRDPYGIAPERRKRQCIFVGTTNKQNCLPRDRTGNRRFIPIMCDGDKAELHPVEHEAEARHDIEQCFAELMLERRKCGRLSLKIPKEILEELKELQEASTPDDTRVGMIQEFLDQNYGKHVVCTRIIYEDLFNDPDHPVEPKEYELREIADILNSGQITGWERYKGKSGNVKDAKYLFDRWGRQRAWIRRPVEPDPAERFRPVEKSDQNPFTDL